MDILRDERSRGQSSGEINSAPQSEAGGRVVRRAKGVNQQEIVKTHGLQAPDGVLNKERIFRSILSPLSPGKLLDLGAGEGNFSMIAASLGWEVTAVDVRKVPRPEADPAHDAGTAALFESIVFIQSDVREFAFGRNEYDMVCILGLLHHLEVPDQVALIRKCAGTPLLIDTRIASAEIDTFGEYTGMLIKEHGETREERDQVTTASWGNEMSFRHTEESLTQLLRDCGYPIVLQARPPHRREYTFYFALPRVQESAFRREKRARNSGREVGAGEPNAAGDADQARSSL